MNESTMKSCQTNRIEYIDIAKGILIILVVVGHVTNAAHYLTYGIKAVITTFHMPAFFVITGLLTDLEKIQCVSIKTFLLKKASRLLVPYVFFEITGGLWQMLLMGTDAVNLIGIFSGILTIHCHVGADWFLPTIFFAEIGVYLLIRMCNKKIYPLISAACLVGAFILSDITYLVACCRRILVAIAFILTGLSFKTIFKKKNLFALIAAIIVTIATAYFNGVVDLATRRFGNHILYIIGSLAGTYSILCVSQYLTGILARILSRIGKSSLVIMGTHQNVQVAFNVFFGSTYSLPLQLVVFVTILLYEVVTVVVYERYIPFLVGAKYKYTKQKILKG